MVVLPRDKIADLCRAHGVTRLELFGSAADKRFGTNSDYDFFITFDLGRVRGIAHYFKFKDELEALLGRPVDLVDRARVYNKTFLRAADQARELVYAA